MHEERIQKSVFECGLSPDALHLLKIRLEHIIEPTEDSIMFIPLGQGSRGNIRWQGKPPSTASEPFWIV